MITQGWWCNDILPRIYDLPQTHQTVRLDMTNNRLFSSSTNSGDIWDLRDSVLELCENEQRVETSLKSKSDYFSLKSSFDEEKIQQWLESDPGNGFIRIFPPDASEFFKSCLIPCNVKTPVHQICQNLGIGSKVLHMQMNGGVIRRLEPHELPLSIQNDLLVSIGYSDLIRIQEEGPKEDLAYLIKFYSGKPICDAGSLSTPIQGNVQVKKGGVFQQWTNRWCAIYNTRIHFYKDEYKKDSPAIFQLTGGTVEMTEGKGFEFCLKITSRDNEKQIFLNFANEDECLAWFKKCKKATDRLPTMADLSRCHLEYLPENIFINKDLMVLNLQHNLLKDRPNEEDTMLGWIDDLERFTHLRSINLADNNLQQFPLSICKITSLVELNLASNKIKEVPSNVKLLENLQSLHLHNNLLTNLPDEIVSMKRLSVLVLAFNRFASIPSVVAQLTNIRFSEVEGVVMAGNQIERIATDVLMELKHARKLDLRLNALSLPLTETMKFSVLEHLSHLDVRDNQIAELDLRSVKTLEILCCERNGMTSLSLHGGSLKVILASCNCLDQLVIFPKPEGLVHIDLSDNCLEYLPDWISDCHQLKKLIVHENFLRELPARLFASAKKLVHVSLAHNHLTSLPSEIGELSLENLQIQHNYIFLLPQNLLKKLTRLTVFNSSRSLLQSLPDVHENVDLNRLQELHLSGNFLGNDVMKIISGYSRLKILNLAHNEITELYDDDIIKLEMLQELNVSWNQLQSLPESLGRLSSLTVLRVHSNYLTSLPNFCNAKSLRILDVSHNKLLNISVTDLMASKLNLLDIGLNEQLKVDRTEFRNIVGKKNICLVDSSGQNRKVPGLTRKKFTGTIEEDPSFSPWKVGFSESSGSRNKLCIQIVKFLDFNNNKDCLVGIFDGGKNSELPKLLAKTIKKLFLDELNHPGTRDKFMKYAFLSAHRSLKLTGQKMGVSAALCHIQKTMNPNAFPGNHHQQLNGGTRGPQGQMFSFVMTIANVGDVEAVLCRKGEAVLLTRKFVAPADVEETQRVCKSNGIITEDGKVNGVTPCTRLLGCSHLYPHVVPDPYCVSLPLQSDDEFVIVANSSFWRYVPYEEAVEEAYDIGNPIVASKRLQDLAECYGSKENLAVLILRLNTEPGPSLGRLKPPHREMSIDDVEAAIQHDLEISQRRSTQKKIIGGQHFQTLSYVKNRQLCYQSIFPSTRTFNQNNNNNINYANNNNKSSSNSNPTSPTSNFPRHNQSPESSVAFKPISPETKKQMDSKMVTFQLNDRGSDSTTESSSSSTNTGSGSSFGKVPKNSSGEVNSSSTYSHSSSTEGSILFRHNGSISSKSKHPQYDILTGSSSSGGGSSIRDEGVQNPRPVHRRVSSSSPAGMAKTQRPPMPSEVKKIPVETSGPCSPANGIKSPAQFQVRAEVHERKPQPSKEKEEGMEKPIADEDFPDHLKVDGCAQTRRASRSKLPPPSSSSSSRPQSRFVKRSSALDALSAIPAPGDQASYCCSSGNSLLCDSLSELNPTDHANKITMAKEKKLSMYLASNKLGVPGVQKEARVNSEVDGQRTPALNGDCRDSEILKIMQHKRPPNPTATKRSSIMNTIAMFESANAGKPPPHPPMAKGDHPRSPDATEAKALGGAKTDDPKTSKGTSLNPIKYQIKSTDRPLEMRAAGGGVIGSSVVRPSRRSNVGAQARAHVESSQEAGAVAKPSFGASFEPYEVAKF